MRSDEILLYAIENPDEIAKLALDILLHYTREIGNLYVEFRRELTAGEADVGEYVALAEELEKSILIDAEYLRELLRREKPKVDIDEDGLFYDMPALLERVGCRLGRDDLVLLGIALGYAYGGFVKKAICALLASAAAELGKPQYVAEIGEKCGADLPLMVRVTCSLARLADEEGLDHLAGMSQVLRELRGE